MDHGVYLKLLYS